MAASERVTVDFADAFNESDEFDHEYNPRNPRFPYQEFEMDIADFYKDICCGNMFNNPNRKRMRSVSVQTNPDTSNIPPSWLLVCEELVDCLYTGLGNIINTMYHAPQSCNREDATRRASISRPAMKYFTFENGYWRSKLLPNIKIPDRVEADWQNRALCSEDTKAHLRHLLEVATRLRNGIPYVSRCASSRESEQVVDNNEGLQSCRSEKVDPSAELQTGQSSDHDPEDLDYPVESGGDSGKSSASYSPEYCDRKKAATDRAEKEAARGKRVILNDSRGSDPIPGLSMSGYAHNRQEMASGKLASEYVPEMASGKRASGYAQNAKEMASWKRVSGYAQEMASGKCVMPVDSSRGSDEIPGVSVYGYEQRSRLSQGLRKKDLNVEHPSKSGCATGKSTGTNVAAPASCRFLDSCSSGFKLVPRLDELNGAAATVKPNVDKLALSDPENCPQNKLGSREKNFIRKNIMDLKNKSNRVSCVKNNLSSNSEARGAGQSRGRRGVSPLSTERIKFYNKFLR